MKKLDGTNNKPIPMRNLAKIRKQSGRTQRNLSVMLGFSQELISKYERGLSNPSINSLKKMATFFNCSVDYLIDFSDNLLPNITLTQEQADIIFKYNMLSKNDKARLEGYLDSLLSNKQVVSWFLILF